MDLFLHIPLDLFLRNSSWPAIQLFAILHVVDAEKKNDAESRNYLFFYFWHFAYSDMS